MELLDKREIEQINNEINEILDAEEPVKKKRGRKPKDKKEKYYFGEREENAVIEYIRCSKVISNSTKEIIIKTFNWEPEHFDNVLKQYTKEGRGLYDLIELADGTLIEDNNTKYQISVLKEEISKAQKENDVLYNTILKPAFKKMIEAIMRAYHKYIPSEESGLTFNDTLTFLLTKIDKYEIGRNTRAYSYYGNICKNYLSGKYITYKKELLRNPSYDDDGYEFNLTNNIEYSVKADKGAKTAHEIVEHLKARILTMVESPEKSDLKNSEVVLGKALINLLDNWDYVISTDGSNKLNKSAVLFFLREQTGLDTKGIRDNMKKFRNEFLLIKNFIIS